MQIRILATAKITNAVDAWRLSRDPSQHPDTEMIAGVDAPVMEMPSAILNFQEFTIVEREIFCSLRNHVVWARTSRVDDPREFTCPEIFRTDDHELYRRRMILCAEQGQKQDEWRLLLPLCAHTNWTQRISLRDLARLAVYFGYLQKKVADRQLAIRFGEVQYRIIETLCEMLDGKLAIALLNSQKVIKFLHEESLPVTINSTRLPNFTIINACVNVGLRAQIVRHRELQFVDDFLSVINTDDFSHLQLSKLVNMQLVARNDVWQAVLSKRACWIAQAELWQPLIKSFGWHPPLPCAETNQCPFEVDARARLEPGKDPNPPCPVFCNLYKVPKGPHISAMMAEAKRRGDFWVAETQR